MNASKTTVKSLYDALKDGIENAVRPNNIPRGVWSKQINSDLKWINDILGPSSKLYKTLDTVTLPWIDGAMVLVDVGVGYYENVENNESTREIISDITIDASVGTATVVAGTLISTVISGAVAGTALGSAVPGIGTVFGFAAGILISIGGYYLDKWLDDTI